MKAFRSLQIATPLIVISVIWELAAHSSHKVKFLFGSPLLILDKLVSKTLSGELALHTAITGVEAFIGLIWGITIGSTIGFLLLYYQNISGIAKPYIIALSSIPIFGIAPMMIIWFGIDIEMKIAMAFFSTVFIAIFQAFQGGQNVSKVEDIFFKLHGASRKQKFWKLTLPTSIDWIIQSLKLNSGMAILGAFIGEFIASNGGLGYVILKASGLYDVPYVLAAVICIIFLSTLFNILIHFLERNKLKIIRAIAIKMTPKS